MTGVCSRTSVVVKCVIEDIVAWHGEGKASRLGLVAIVAGHDDAAGW